MRGTLRTMAFGVLAIALWALVTSRSTPLLPGPVAVARALVASTADGTLPVALVKTLWRLGLGYGVALLVGIPLGTALARVRLVKETLGPIVLGMSAVPSICWLPLAILWFGLGNPPAFFLISLGAFFPVLVNTIAGVQSVDGIYLRVARNLGAGRATTFWRVILPAAAPYILAGARIGMGTAFIVVIVSEMIAVNNGLGYRILEAREYMWSDKIIAGMLTIGLLGLGIDSLMGALSRRLLRWHRGME